MTNFQKSAHFSNGKLKSATVVFNVGHLNLTLHLALRRVLSNDLADLILLRSREVVIMHFEGVETGLPGEQHQQRAHASITIFRKPCLLVVNCDAL